MKQLSKHITEALKIGSKSKVSSNNAQTFKEFNEKYDCGLLERKLTGIFKEQLLNVYKLTYMNFRNRYEDRILGDSLSNKYRFNVKKEYNLLSITCKQRNNAKEMAYVNILKGKTDNDEMKISWWIDSNCDNSVESTFVKIFENIINLKF